MEYNTSRTWLEIDLDAIAENHRRIKADIGESEIIAVVKADAYGLGAPYISRFRKHTHPYYLKLLQWVLHNRSNR
ncbi:MAG: alanine racemase [Clostridia bacterium]|nr:alanine racemase [Clostridia bacterium]